MNVNAYYNGEYKNKSEISVPLTDRAVFFGDGIYDAAIGRNGKIFMFEEHITRFLTNANALKIPLPFTALEIKKIILKTVRLSQEASYFVYFQLSRFSEERVHAASSSEKSNLLVTVSPFTLSGADKKINLIIKDDVRHSMCNIKTLNLLPSVLSSSDAADAGADEAVFVREGVVTECSHSNIHIVKKGKIVTHPLDKFILPGISRMHMLSVCDRLAIPYDERNFGTDELFDADEVIVTSSSKLAVTVNRIGDTFYTSDEHSVSEKIRKKMREEFLFATL